MKTNKIILALIVAGFVTNTFAAKPPPKPAQDVDCVGCVDTADIADGAVTTNKLSTVVQQQIDAAGPDRTADLCRLYSLLHGRAVIGDISVPDYCDIVSKEPRLVFNMQPIPLPPDLGGLVGADAQCQATAEEAGLQGSYRAWLSDSTISAAQRMTHNNGPYVRTDGVVIAHDWDDLIDGELMAPISVGPYPGVPIPHLVVITGTLTDGSAWVTDVINSNYCGGWTGSTIGAFSQGDPTATDRRWTGQAGWTCDFGDNASLYCIQQ